MKNFIPVFIAFISFCTFSQASAQQHTLQIDDGASHYSIIKGSATGGTYTLPSGGGTLLTSAASALSFADFYALMPGDNAATIAAGTAVQFPQNGPADGSGSISRTSASVINLFNIGTYEVFFQVSVNEAGQLGLKVNGTEQASTIVGRATGTSQITAMCLVTTTVINTTLEVVNPTGNPTALTITPLAGGTHAVSAHLVIKQLK